MLQVGSLISIYSIYVNYYFKQSKTNKIIFQNVFYKDPQVESEK